MRYPGEVVDVNTIDSKAVNCVSVEHNHTVITFRDIVIPTTLYNSLFDYGSPVCCLQHLVDSSLCLWITVESLWLEMRQDEPLLGVNCIF